MLHFDLLVVLYRKFHVAVTSLGCCLYSIAWPFDPGVDAACRIRVSSAQAGSQTHLAPAHDQDTFSD